MHSATFSKTYILFFLLLVMANSSRAQRRASSYQISANIILRSQSDVDNFRQQNSTLDEIRGDLIIKYDINNPPLDPINDLSRFPPIRSIGGDLIIEDHLLALSSLEGLHTIKSVRGDLKVINCQQLLDLRGLRSVSRVSGQLRVEANGQLESLSGLDRITSVKDFYLVRNLELESLYGLRSLRSISGNCIIVDNDALVNLDGAQALQSIGRAFRVSLCDILESLFGLNSLTQIGGAHLGSLNLEDLPSLAHLEDLTGLTSLRGNLNINRNERLTSLNGLQNMEVSNALVIGITNNPELFDCDFICGALRSKPGTVTITGNASNCNLTTGASTNFCNP